MNPRFSINEHRSFARRRGAFSLIEMMIAATVLSILLATIGQFLQRWQAARRSAEDRVLAVRIVENVLEAAAAEVKRTGQAPEPSLPVEAAEQLRDSRLKLTVGTPDDRGWGAVTATLNWRNGEGQSVVPVSVTAWLPLRATSEGGSP